MKIVVAFDSFKHALRSPAVCSAFAAGFRDIAPAAEIIEIPLADGGEGTLEAAAAAGGEIVCFPIHDPLGRPVTGAALLTGGGHALIEVASGCGIELLTPAELNPLRASSAGVGELLAHLAGRGVTTVIAGLGGSATVDGGIGMLQALGWRFFDRNNRLIVPGAGGEALGRVKRIEAPSPKPELSVIPASDVTNLLTGPEGAAAVFGPQKGATPEMVAMLDAGLRNYREAWGIDDEAPGDGAAGGLGFAFRAAFDSRCTPGAELLLDRVGFDRRIAGAAFVVTGEGRSDGQTRFGKLPAVVARRAARQGIPTILVSGGLAPDAEELRNDFAALFSLATGPGTLDEALRSTAENLRRMGRNLAGMASVISRKSRSPALPRRAE
ncbi:MAG: glycerate kinase [Victivallaceae bacterium]